MRNLISSLIIVVLISCAEKKTEKQIRKPIPQDHTFFDFGISDTLFYGNNEGALRFKDLLEDSIISKNDDNYRAIFMCVDLHPKDKPLDIVEKLDGLKICDSFSTSTTKVNDYLYCGFTIDIDSSYTTGYYKLNAKVEDLILLRSHKDSKHTRKIERTHYLT